MSRKELPWLHLGLPPPENTIIATVLALFAVSIHLFTSSTLAFEFECAVCPENFYCDKGVKNACPSASPVTIGIKNGGVEDCMTCVEKSLRLEEANPYATPVFDSVENKCISCIDASTSTPAWSTSENKCVTCDKANEDFPVYDDVTKSCVSCSEINENAPVWGGDHCTCEDGFYENEFVCEGNKVWNGASCVCPKSLPVWNGTECTTCLASNENFPLWNGSSCTNCPRGTKYNSDTANCEKLVVTIKTATGSFNLSVDMIFVPVTVSLPLAECQELISDDKYPEVTLCMSDSNYSHLLDAWAGAVKYCRDQGKRLPTLEELSYVARELYGDNSIVDNKTNLTIANYDLWNILTSAGVYNNEYTGPYFWSSEETNFKYSAVEIFSETAVKQQTSYGRQGVMNAFCIPQ